MTFIQELWGLYPTFRDHLDIQFIPFGKSHVSFISSCYLNGCQVHELFTFQSVQESPESDIEFVCRNRGPNECLGNRIQGCMLRFFPDQDAVITVVGTLRM